MLIALAYKIFAFNFFVFVGLVIFAISGTFAFMKINGMPFHFFVLNLLQSLRRPNLRVWNNKLVPEIRVEQEKEKAPDELMAPPKQGVSSSRLTELALIVDTQGVYKGEGGQETEIRKKEEEEKTPGERLTKDFAI